MVAWVVAVIFSVRYTMFFCMVCLIFNEFVLVPKRRDTASLLNQFVLKLSLT
jgi:hypothetical protein